MIFKTPTTILDVPFVPSDSAVVQAMLELAELGPRDVLYDLGSGDGRIVISAAKSRGARAIGIDLDPMRVADAMENAGDAGVEFLVDFIEGDIFEVDISEATVVTLYLLDPVNVELRPRLLNELQAGSRIISQTFDMGDWQADQEIRVNGNRLYKWVVPAQIAGSWAWEGLDGTPYQLDLEQHYQEVDGHIWIGDTLAHLERASLCGPHLSLVIQDPASSTQHHFTLIFEEGTLQSVLEGE